MAIPKKGSRKIVVDGIGYRWYIRRKPSYSQELQGQETMTLAIQQELDTGITILYVQLNCSRPDAWFRDVRPITPKNVELYIRTALEKGWQADIAGKPFILTENS